MSQRLPDLIEPDRMAETGRILQGTLAIKKMKRLRPLLLDDTGDVGVELSFSVDASGQSNVTGKVATDLKIQCQRCMQAMNLHIEEHVSLAIVHSSQQANDLPSHYEPLLVDEESVSLQELVEDELLLALPSVPLHEPDECSAKVASTDAATNTSKDLKKTDGIDQQEDSERKNPFEILKQLQNKD